MALAGLVFLFMAIAVGGALGFVLYWVSKNKNHPSSLASESRRAVRPVREAVDRLERLVEQNRGKAEVDVIGPQAIEAAKKVHEECMKWAAARDELAPLARRERGEGRATELIGQIDAKLDEAVVTVDGMATRMAERAVSTYDIPQDNDLDEMLNRLESLGQSMDEAQETLDVKIR